MELIVFCLFPFLMIALPIIGFMLVQGAILNFPYDRWALLVGPSIVLCLYAFGIYLIRDGGYSQGMGVVILYATSLIILTLTCLRFWLSPGTRRRPLVLAGLAFGLLIPGAALGVQESLGTQAQDCYARSALLSTADSLKRRALSEDLYLALRFDSLYNPIECLGVRQISSRYVHIFGYEQPYWLYHRIGDSYELGYWYRPWLLTWLGTRVCLYDHKTDSVSCAFNRWGPFEGMVIPNAAKG